MTEFNGGKLFLLKDLKVVRKSEERQIGDGQLFSCAYGQLIDARSTLRNQNRSLNDTWMSERVCSHNDTHFHIPQKDVEDIPNLTKFAFIRDPFDRFISFYLHICKNDNGCWNCGDDMRCVVRNVYKSLKNYEKNPDESTSSLVDRHVAPISWNCNFQETLSQYHLIKIGVNYLQRQSAINELTEILKSNGVLEGLITKISNESMSGETFHGTHKTSARWKAEKQVEEDTLVRDYLHKIYFFDYLVFKFETSHLDMKYQKLIHIIQGFKYNYSGSI